LFCQNENKLGQQFILLLVEQFVKNSEFGIWKFVKTCNEQLKCYEEKKCIAVISIINE